VGGAIARLTKWLYADDSQQAVTRIDTEGDVVTETGYDRFGNKTHVYVTGPDGAAISAEDNVWGEDRQLLESTTVSGKTTLRTVNTYDADGALIERNLYKNGALISRVVYIDRDNWTETVYHAGSAVLVTAYRNGTRVKNENSQ
jgi:YD repeat-containing protein